MAGILLSALAQQTLNDIDFAPGGLYPTDSLFKIFGLWALEEMYGFIFVAIFPFAILIATVVRVLNGRRRGEGIQPAIDYALIYVPILLFFLWPVKPNISDQPVFGGPEEDLEALKQAKEDLLENKQRQFKGVPRGLLWGMAIVDTFTNEQIAKVQSLNARPMTDQAMLQIRLAHAMPLDDDLSRKTALFWVLCYEPAVSHMLTQGDATGSKVPDVFDEEIAQHFPNYGKDGWEARIKSLPDREDLLEGTSGCDDVWQKLREDYQEEISSGIIGENHHQKLMEDLRNAGVSFSDEEYMSHLANQAVKSNAGWLMAMPSVISGDADLQHIDVIPTNEDDFFLYRWGSGAVNWVHSWVTNISAGAGTRVGLPGVSKSAYEVFKMLAPSLYGATLMFVIISFSFLSVAIVAGAGGRATLTFAKLYISVQFWPLMWALLNSYQLFFTERNWEGLAAFMGDAGTYTNVGIPFLFVASPALATFLIFTAFSFAGGGGGGGASPVQGATYQTAQAGRETQRAVEQRTLGAAVGVVRGGVVGAGRGGVEGMSVGGPVAALGGAAVGAGVGVAGGAADGVSGEKHPGSRGGFFFRKRDEKVEEAVGVVEDVAKGILRTAGVPTPPESGGRGGGSGGSASAGGEAGGGGSGGAAAGGEAAGGVAAVPPVV